MGLIVVKGGCQPFPFETIGRDEYGPADTDYPTFEMHNGHADGARLKTTDGSPLPIAKIWVRRGNEA